MKLEEIIQAYREGKVIEYYHTGYKTWVEMKSNQVGTFGAFLNAELRIKKEKRKLLYYIWITQELNNMLTLNSVFNFKTVRSY